MAGESGRISVDGGSTRARAFGAVLRNRRLDALLVFFVALAVIFSLESHYRDRARSGLYFQAWSSEMMMQVASISDLQQAPLTSLWYVHASPPAFDAIRAGIAACHSDLSGKPLLEVVDRDLYALWAITYAFVCSMVCAWVGAAAGRTSGVIAALLLMLHPAMLLYAMLLETTLLSALISLWLAFEFWRIGSGKGRGWRLAGAFVAAFLTRSVFQWPALVVLLLALVVARVPWRKVLLVACVAGVVVTAYTVKQVALFGIPYTSSFAGFNFCRSIGGCDALTSAEVRAGQSLLAHHPSASAATVLSRADKLEGANSNALKNLERHKRELLAFRKTLSQRTVAQLLRGYWINAERYFDPSSEYTENVAVDALPWRKAYDRVVSGLPLLALLVASAVWWVRRNRRSYRFRRGLALAMVVGYVAAVSILFERGENLRFKFFLEPVFYVFVATQLSQALASARTRLGRKPRLLAATAC